MFDEAEITILLEALDAWEQKESSDALFSGLLGAIFTKDKEEYKEELSREMDEAKAKTTVRKEQSILIKAKLIQMKQQAIAQDAAAFMAAAP